MTLGWAEQQDDLLDDVTRYCDDAAPEASIYRPLHREPDLLFPRRVVRRPLSATAGAGRCRRRWWPP